MPFADEGRLARINWEVYGHGRLMFPGFSTYSYVASGSAWQRDHLEQQGLFPPALRYQVEEYPYHLGVRSIPQLRLAYWFLLALYLPAWLTLVVVWQYRRARLREASLSPSL